MSRHDPRVRLRHMLDAARDGIEIAQGRTRADLDRDKMLVLSLVKCVEIVGEAAARMERGFQDRHPEVPWPAIIAMRNRLIHLYFDVNRDLLWETVTTRLPALAADLERILASGGA
jgi:uncharacterized protein with HEPN domain